MDDSQYKVLVQSIQHELNTAKDDYRAGRIDKNCLQYVARRLKGFQTQLEIEARKSQQAK